MNKQEQANKRISLMKAFSEFLNNVVMEEQTQEEVGTPVTRYDAMEEGKYFEVDEENTVTDENGDKVPAGQYQIIGSKYIVVDEESKLVEIKDGEPVEDAKEIDAPASDEVEMGAQTLLEEIAEADVVYKIEGFEDEISEELFTYVTGLQDENQALKEKVAELEGKAQEDADAIAEFESQIKALKEEPNPIALKEKTEAKEDKYASLVKRLQKK